MTQTFTIYNRRVTINDTELIVEVRSCNTIESVTNRELYIVFVTGVDNTVDCPLPEGIAYWTHDKNEAIAFAVNMGKYYHTFDRNQKLSFSSHKVNPPVEITEEDIDRHDPPFKNPLA